MIVHEVPMEKATTAASRKDEEGEEVRVEGSRRSAPTI